MIREPRLGRITQGSIFCGAIAEDYEGVPVWGLIITARCDTAHDKTPILNYLPVVRVEDWLKKDGASLVANRAYADSANRFTNLLSQRGLSASLLETYSATEIVSLHFKLDGARSSKDVSRAHECANELEDLDALVSASATANVSCLSKHPKVVSSVLTELLGHRVAGYYFMPDIGTLTEHPSLLGYVVLLREVHHLSSAVAAKLLDGLAYDGSQPVGGVSFKTFDFAYPVAEIQSPWIEHLMQNFCTLFGRIGVEDYDRARAALIGNSVFPGPQVKV